MIGGFQRTSPWKRVDTVYEYNPAKDSWTRKFSMPTGCGELALGVIAGKIYAVGGRGKDGDVSVSEVYPTTQGVHQIGGRIC